MKNFCGDCGVREGELHEEGCDMDRCSKCGAQVLSQGRCKGSKSEPFFDWVFCCQRCGKIMPKMKIFSDEEWKFICGGTYPLDCVLCIECMDFIKQKREENARMGN